jgi:translation initiation factor 3 subunit E
LEEYQYSDPVTAFLKELYVEFDFEAAQLELKRAEEVVKNDFFLGDFREEFLYNARYLISEAYCRIHQRIDIRYAGDSQLAEPFLDCKTGIFRSDSTCPPTKVRNGSSI